VSSGEVQVRLKPGASRNELIGLRDGLLQARVSAPPVDGRANKALCKLIAKSIGVAPSKVAVVRGDRSRQKLVRVDGVDAGALQVWMAGLQEAPGDSGSADRPGDRRRA
jgi:uncharacterized protein (TIGR00251 family)